MSGVGALAFKAMADLVQSVEVLVSTGFRELLPLAPLPCLHASLGGQGYGEGYSTQPLPGLA